VPPARRPRLGVTDDMALKTVEAISLHKEIKPHLTQWLGGLAVAQVESIVESYSVGNEVGGPPRCGDVSLHYCPPLCIDIKFFRRFNGEHGHTGGD
jgi:hypothetical protein